MTKLFICTLLVLVLTGCAGAAGPSAEPISGVPVPASASDASRETDRYTFFSTDTPEQISDFYLEQFEQLGWTRLLKRQEENGDQTTTFTKSGRVIRVTVGPGPDGRTSGIIMEVRP